MAAQVHNLNCDTSDRDAEAEARWSELYTRWLAIQAGDSDFLNQV